MCSDLTMELVDIDLSDDLFAVVVSAVLADSVREHHVVAIRAFYDAGCDCFESLSSSSGCSSFRESSCWISHFYTSLNKSFNA